MKLPNWLRFIRLKAYETALRPFSANRRRLRMKILCDLMGLKAQDRVLDLGGHPDTWEMVDVPLNVTILNLPENMVRKEVAHHNFTYVEGDACAVEGLPMDEFDLVHSNSVIEHVGDAEKQAEFAREVAKFATAYWIQTPSKWFPIEAHCGMPFWWFYPQSLRNWLINRWRPKLPAWTEMVEETRVLEKRKLRELFPRSSILTERFIGIPKSYIVWRKNESIPMHNTQTS